VSEKVTVVFKVWHRVRSGKRTYSALATRL